jgi:hypothetical protein
MANPAKQRLEALRVGEISLVDVPANEAPFLVVKRVEEPTMTKPADPNQPTNQPTNQPQQPQQPTQPNQPNQQPNQQPLTTPTPGQQPNEPNQPQQPDQNQTQPVQKTDGADRPIAPELVKMHEAMVAAYASSAVPQHMKKHIAEMHGTLRGLVANTPGAGDAPSATATTQKTNGDSLPGLVDDKLGSPIPPLPTGAGMNAAMVKSAIETTVEKIGRKISAERMAKIKAGLAPFLELIKELDPDCLPELLGLPIVQAVQASAPGSEVEKQVKDLTESNVALQKRVQELEQLRGVSKALPNDVNATPQPTQKSFWKGVL